MSEIQSVAPESYHGHHGARVERPDAASPRVLSRLVFKQSPRLLRDLEDLPVLWEETFAEPLPVASAQTSEAFSVTSSISCVRLLAWALRDPSGAMWHAIRLEPSGEGFLMEALPDSEGQTFSPEAILSRFRSLQEMGFHATDALVASPSAPLKVFAGAPRMLPRVLPFFPDALGPAPRVGPWRALPLVKTKPQPPFARFQKQGTSPWPHHYPIVDTARWVHNLSKWGCRFLQYRRKDWSQPRAQDDLADAAEVCRQQGTALVINDRWDLACQFPCWGVHLGFEDLFAARLHHISAARLGLGLSTHRYFELATAMSLQPSYVALGPVNATSSKSMPWRAQGKVGLGLWRYYLPPHTPLVGIGGVNLGNALDLYNSGADILSYIRDLTDAADPHNQFRLWQSLLTHPTKG